MVPVGVDMVSFNAADGGLPTPITKYGARTHIPLSVRERHFQEHLPLVGSSLGVVLASVTVCSQRGATTCQIWAARPPAGR